LIFWKMVSKILALCRKHIFQMKIDTREQATKKKLDAAQMERFKKKRIKATAYIFAVTTGTIITAGLLGFVFDLINGTKPIGMVAFVLISFPINQFFLVKILKKKFT